MYLKTLIITLFILSSCTVFETKKDDKTLKLENEFFTAFNQGQQLIAKKDYKNAINKFDEAIKIKITVDKSHVLLLKGYSYFRLNDVSKTKEEISNIQKYLKDNDSYNNRDKKDMLTFLQTLVNDPTITKEQLEFMEISRFSPGYRKYSEEKLIETKQYARALAAYNPSRITDWPISYVIVYDLLSTLVYPKSYKKPYCLKKYAKYPNSIAFSMQICRILKLRIENKPITNEDIANLQKHLKTYYPKRLHLLEMTKKIITLK